ncbi:LacI family DNA-binding transcriptional regulator [Neomegalonema sp.]|uniref:LacI family DNA-binding transcriptional regulator n=1 Tax=Neomegalonema sp. TaxID=2039713 RepID=UPI00262AD468|nr:LacI family DNA-binding transcriptional regulator [Neomegalonema sp.]MDD2869287.1 LacI family DNA-binding transcriptional regulator [Neomegalonema sp.]
MKKPTLHDVAAAAGVSYATADRVLNARGGVAEKSEIRVREAIRRLGYVRDIHAATLSRRRRRAFRFLLPAGDHGFFARLRAALLAERLRLAADRIEIALQEFPPFDAEALAEALEALAPEDCDGLAVVAAESPRAARALARLKAGGVPVVALVADAGPEARDVYVGVDNLGAGRTAGRLIRLAHRGGRRGLVLPILGSPTARDHRDRLEGLRQVLAEEPQPLTALPALEARDDPDRMRELVRAALREDPPPTALYSMGAGNRGLVEALREAAPERRPMVVLHELTPHSRKALEEDLVDVVIDQKPAREIAAALAALRSLAEGRAIPAGLGAITPALHLKDNPPAAPSAREASGDLFA